MATITIQPATLRWAVQQSDSDPKAIASKTSLHDLPAWLASKAPIALSFNKISKLSTSLHVPFGALVRTQVPKEQDDEVVQYRTINNRNVQPSQNLRALIHSMRGKQGWAHDELTNLGLGRNTLVASAQHGRSPKAIAAIIKKHLALHDDWPLHHGSSRKRFNVLRDIIADAGVLVMGGTSIDASHLDIKEFRAFVLLDDLAPLIFINRNDADDAMLFSLLHELVHIALGREEIFNDSAHPQSTANEERLINQTVMELVLPETAFPSVWKTLSATHDKTADIAETMATTYGLSTMAFLIKARQLGLATEDDIAQEQQAITERLEQNPKKKATGGNQNITNASHFDSRFVGLVKQGIDSGSLSYTDGFSLLGVHSPSAYDGLLAEKGLA